MLLFLVPAASGGRLVSFIYGVRRGNGLPSIFSVSRIRQGSLREGVTVRSSWIEMHSRLAKFSFASRLVVTFRVELA